MPSKNYNLATSGLLIAIGILLPIAFHSFKMGGQIFLPMHLPVLLGGFMLPWQFAGAVGLITPFLSFLFTSMPPVPGVFGMMAELFTYGFVASVAYNKLRLGIYPSLITSMLAGRFVSIVGNWIIAAVIMGKTFNFVKFTYGLFVVALPGIAIQLILLPILVKLIVTGSRKNEPHKI
ncbi:ECF transporter S component [Thermoanaerobacterium sp. DL9XJH110]|uniref:ECF transporter S component n=1 Tax=Thermoanaerobacterium sp. DL9XJH110 TaxID=3386643 RepID=UPI003BB6EDD8